MRGLIPLMKVVVSACVVFSVPSIAKAQNANFFCGAARNQVCTFALYGPDGLEYRVFPLAGQTSAQVSGITFGQDVFCVGINYRPPDDYRACRNEGNYMRVKGLVRPPPAINLQTAPMWWATWWWAT